MHQQRTAAPGARRLAGVRLLGAILIGMATLLGPKHDPTEHWATPPRALVVVVEEDPADPGERLDEVDLALLRAGDARH